MRSSQPTRRGWTTLLAFAAVVASCIALPAGAQATDAGRTPPGKLCEKNGFRLYVTSEGRRFANAGQCASYVARGGRVVPLAAARCLGTGYLDVYGQDGRAFSSARQCVDFVAGGGALAGLKVTLTPASGDRLQITLTGFGLQPLQDPEELANINTCGVYSQGDGGALCIGGGVALPDGTVTLIRPAFIPCETAGQGDLLYVTAIAITAAGEVLTTRRVPAEGC